MLYTHTRAIAHIFIVLKIYNLCVYVCVSVRVRVRVCISCNCCGVDNGRAEKIGRTAVVSFARIQPYRIHN